MQIVGQICRIKKQVRPNFFSAQKTIQSTNFNPLLNVNWFTMSVKSSRPSASMNWLTLQIGQIEKKKKNYTLFTISNIINRTPHFRTKCCFFRPEPANRLSALVWVVTGSHSQLILLLCDSNYPNRARSSALQRLRNCPNLVANGPLIHKASFMFSHQK